MTNYINTHKEDSFIKNIIKEIQEIEAKLWKDTQERIKDIRDEVADIINKHDNPSEEIIHLFIKERIELENEFYKERLELLKNILVETPNAPEIMNQLKEFHDIVIKEIQNATRKLKSFIPMENDFNTWEMFKDSLLDNALKTIEAKFNSLDNNLQEIAKQSLEDAKNTLQNIKWEPFFEVLKRESSTEELDSYLQIQASQTRH